MLDVARDSSKICRRRVPHCSRYRRLKCRQPPQMHDDEGRGNSTLAVEPPDAPTEPKAYSDPEVLLR